MKFMVDLSSSLRNRPLGSTHAVALLCWLTCEIWGLKLNMGDLRCKRPLKKNKYQEPVVLRGTEIFSNKPIK